MTIIRPQGERVGLLSAGILSFLLKDKFSEITEMLILIASKQLQRLLPEVYMSYPGKHKWLFVL